MKIKDLIKTLNSLNPDVDIVLNVNKYINIYTIDEYELELNYSELSIKTFKFNNEVRTKLRN